MEQDKSDAGVQTVYRGKKLNWWLVRKIETLIFASMLLAIPFLALRIMETASTALTVQTTSLTLVRDLYRAKEISRVRDLKITVSSVSATTAEPCSYLIQNGKKTIEQVLLPRGLILIGSVTFDEKGQPPSPCSFLLSKGSESVCIDINSQGQISVR
jgi:hypothetical protein